jgi:hypothetical protein
LSWSSQPLHLRIGAQADDGFLARGSKGRGSVVCQVGQNEMIVLATAATGSAVPFGENVGLEPTARLTRVA